MKKKDIVRIKKGCFENEALIQNCIGIVCDDSKDGYCNVAFIDIKNKQGVALLNIKDENLELLKSSPNDVALSYDNEEIKEYDIVQLVADREKYKKFGLKKGYYGEVCAEKPSFETWFVRFVLPFDDDNDGIYAINSKDLKIVHDNLTIDETNRLLESNLYKKDH